jgi:DNA-directed RNA polymerase subunit RPC12/RpoP
MDTWESEQTAPEIVVTPYDILFECPNCDKSMVIDEAAAGMMVECLQCHTNVIVPPRTSAPVGSEQWTEASELLLLAAQRGDSGAVNAALAQGADVNAANYDSMTALMFAARQGNEDCVRALIDRGANLEAKRVDGETAVTLAQHAGHYGIVRILWKASGR